ncbi:MAG: glycosyltransferase [Bacteroidota bacterium]
MTRRIAMISEHASPLADLGGVDSGGQNVYVAQLSENLCRLGYEVDVFTRRDDPTLPEIYEWSEGLRVIHVPAGPPEFVRKEELLAHMGAFTEYMIDFFGRQKQAYDLIHANFWMSGLVAADLKQRLGIPFVITFHALGEVRRKYQGAQDGFPDARLDIERRIVEEADRIVAECPQDQADLLEYYAADAARIRIIPCGFDPQELWPLDKAGARLEVGIGEDEWVVLQLGRMVPRKGVSTAIRGFARLARQPDIRARMVIVGGESRDPDPGATPEIGRLQEVAREEGILDKVIFTGRRSRQELKYYYSAADVFVSTPWYEPFGITPVESMACGTPVIGANVGGIKYTVVDQETGYLVPPNDPEAIGERLIELYRDPEKSRRLGAQASARVNEVFTWWRVSEMMSELYAEVIGEQAPQAFQMTPPLFEFEERGREDELLIVSQGFDQALETLQRSRRVLEKGIVEAADLLISCLARGNKVMVCGNGGSAADAQHFAAELVGRFVAGDRGGLPVLALTADTAFLTAWSNDVGYEKVFSRQIEALGRPGDLVIGISTSGRSRNLVEAFTAARQMGIESLALLGGDGGDVASLSSEALVVPGWNTQRIQETHILILHLLCELVERHVTNTTWVYRNNFVFSIGVDRRQT